jgi:hypothetical protein
MNKATYLPEFDSTSATDAYQRFYRLDPPLQGHEYVCVSAVMVLDPETLIFPADEQGNITSFLDLDGSFKGLDHERALRNAGYEVV